MPFAKISCVLLLSALPSLLWSQAGSLSHEKLLGGTWVLVPERSVFIGRQVPLKQVLIYEALTAVRPYKPPMSPTRAYRIMMSMDKHFDRVLLLDAPFLDITGQVSTDGERGLLAVARLPLDVMLSRKNVHLDRFAMLAQRGEGLESKQVFVVRQLHKQRGVHPSGRQFRAEIERVFEQRATAIDRTIAPERRSWPRADLRVKSFMCRVSLRVRAGAWYICPLRGRAACGR